MPVKARASEAEIVELYLKLKSGKEVARHFNMWPTRVYSVLRKHNVARTGHLQGRRKNNVTDDQIVDCYLQCMSGRKVSRDLGVCEKVVYEVLNDRDIPTVGREHWIKNHKKFGKYSEGRIVEAYKNGKSATSLAKKHDCSVWTITEVLKRHRVKIRSKTSLSDDEKKYIYKHYSGGSTIKNISQEINRTEATIIRFIHNEHPEIRREKWRRGSENPCWKGGKTRHYSGYIMVRIQDDDPYASMRHRRSNSVPEHRLVMARALGRPLESHETVHHVNGVVSDNYLENLELRQGPHGRGAKMQCLDCGSHRIEAVPLG